MGTGKEVGTCPKCNDPIYADNFHVCKGESQEQRPPEKPPAPVQEKKEPPPKPPARPPQARRQNDGGRGDEESEKRLRTLQGLMVEFPQLEPLRDLYREDKAEFWRTYQGAVLKAAAETYDLPIAGVEMPPGHHRPYVNYHGLLVKTHKDPRRLRLLRTVPVLYPFGIHLLNQPQDEYTRRYFIGTSDEQMAVFEGIVLFEDGSEFHAQGTAHPGNTNRMVRNYLIEMADTRAACRTMRRATGVGLLSVEELEERGISSPTRDMVSPLEMRRRSALRDEARELFFRAKLNRANEIAVLRRYTGVDDLLDADPEKTKELIEHLQKAENERKGKRRSGNKRRETPAGVAGKEPNGSGDKPADGEAATSEQKSGSDRKEEARTT